MGKKGARVRTFIQSSRALGAAEKAAYHQLAGAGRSRVKRRFFGLSQDDVDAIADRVASGIKQHLRDR